MLFCAGLVHESTVFDFNDDGEGWILRNDTFTKKGAIKLLNTQKIPYRTLCYRDNFFLADGRLCYLILNLCFVIWNLDCPHDVLKRNERGRKKGTLC